MIPEILALFDCISCSIGNCRIGGTRIAKEIVFFLLQKEGSVVRCGNVVAFCHDVEVSKSILEALCIIDTLVRIGQTVVLINQAIADELQVGEMPNYGKTVYQVDFHSR